MYPGSSSPSMSGGFGGVGGTRFARPRLNAQTGAQRPAPPRPANAGGNPGPAPFGTTPTNNGTGGYTYGQVPPQQQQPTQYSSTGLALPNNPNNPNPFNPLGDGGYNGHGFPPGMYPGPPQQPGGGQSPGGFFPAPPPPQRPTQYSPTGQPMPFNPNNPNPFDPLGVRNNGPPQRS